MPKGVRLRDASEGTPVGAHVHCAGPTWAITSHVPVGPEMLTAPVLDRVLPGRLGCYVYPQDAVFHMTSRATTSRTDLDDVTASERVGASDGEWVNHLTVDALPEEAPPESEEEDEEEGEEEEGEEGNVAEEVWASEDDD